MKSILLITNIYPNNDPSYGGTSVCHYFAQEWVSMGYNVQVIHFETRFPRLYYFAGKLLNSYIQAKTGAVAYTNVPKEPSMYNVGNVPVFLVPIKKYVPHTRFNKNRMLQAFAIVCDYLNANNYVPDAVVGHFALPQLEFLDLFKRRYPTTTTCMVLHSSGGNIPHIYKNDYQELMQSVDVWGFRSIAFKNAFESLFGKKEKAFLCYSGIPKSYLSSKTKDFEKGVSKYSFVGSLYKLKRVEDSIQALHNVYSNSGYTFDIVGSGAEYANLQSFVSNLNEADCVKFHGRLKRDDAQIIMENTDCFIMVSSHEAFGLVYVEAMAKGCIVVGTTGQGIDGIIVHGENGFLCESNNPNMLTELINHIKGLSSSELQKISLNAQKTASKLTNRQVAEDYINFVFS